jgi:PAS domain S-box-containing protein
MKNKPANVALRTCLVYAVVGGAWILLSGRMLLAVVADPVTRNRLEICKGWAFVAVTALLLYFVLRSQLRRWEQAVIERKRVEEALSESHERFRILVEQAADAFFVHDPDGRILDVNRCACESLGYSREKLLQMNVLDLEPDFNLTDARSVWDRIQPGEALTLNGRHRRRNGTIFPVEVRLCCFELGGQRVFLGLAREITERKQAEEALRNSERLLRLVMDLVPHFIFVKDRQSRHLLVNRACADATNLTAEQMAGLSDLDMAPGSEQAKAFMSGDQEVITSGRPKFSEERLTDARGRTRILQTTKIPFPANPGSPFMIGNGDPAIVGVSVDITTLKQAEEALKQSEERLREVMRSARCILNCGEVEAPAGWRERVMNELTIFRWNFPVLNEEAAQEVLPLDVPPGKTYQEVWSESRNPDDFNEMHRVTRDAFLQDKPFYRNEFRCTDKHGVEHWMQEFITIHKLAENRWQIFGINTDITDLKKIESALRESEAKFRSYVENAPLAVIVADEKGRLVDCNPAAVNLLGYDARTLLGTSITDLHPAEDVEEVRQAYQMLATEKHIEGEYRFKRRDGKLIWVSLRAVMTGSGHSIGFCQDITERRRAAETIANERQLLRTLIDLLPETFYVKDLESRFLVANAALAKHLGKESPSQIVGRTDADFFPPEAAAGFRAAELKVLNGEPLIEHEGRGVSPSGRECIHLTTKVPFRDSQGRIQGLVGIGRDITERKQAEETFVAQQKLLDNLIAAVPDLVYFKDRQSRFIRVNEAYVKRARLTDVQAAAGKTDFDIFGEQHAREAYEDEQRIMATGEAIINKEEREDWPDGRITWATSTKMPLLDSGGNIVGTMGISRDVTEQKQAEEELRRLNRSLETLSKCNEVVVRATDETELLTKICQIITQIGGFPLAWVGYSEPDESKSVRPIAWAGAEARYLENLQVSWADGERGHGPTGVSIRTGQPATFSNLAENPNFAPWREAALRHGFSSSIGLPLKADDKTFGALTVYSSQAGAFNTRETALLAELADDLAFGIATLRNRVQRKQLEEQLRQSQKMEAVGQLAGGVAHDFNNILTVIQGNASLLLNPQLDPAERSGCSRQVVQAAERAASLTRQLLIFSRKQVMRPASVDLNEVVANLTKMLRRILGEDIVLQTNYAPELAIIHADTGMIEQVLMNLLVNARDAMPTGGQLSISTSKEKFSNAQVEKNPDAVAGTHVRLTVRDTGCGIPRENLSRIFEPFFTTKAVGKGTGLGLATVYSIVQQHRGWITASSEVNKGSTFNIYFPAVEGERAEREAAPAATKLPRGTGTILVVEDELAVRVLVSNLLQRCGYTVLAAESGVAAMKVWQEHQDRIQLLLTDIIMPDGMNGYELAQQLQAARPGLKVVYTSGYSGEVVGKSLSLADGVNFLQKPYLPQKLLQMLQDQLGHN